MTTLRHFCAELAERAESARNLEELRRSMLERVGEVVPFESKHWVNSPHGKANTEPVNLMPEVPWPTLPRYYEDPMRYSIQRIVLAAQTAGGAVADREVFSPAETERLPLYSEILRPADVRTFASCVIGFRGRMTSIVGLCRHGRGARIQEREVRLLAAMARALGLVEAAFLLETAASGRDGRGGLEAGFGLSARERQVAKLIAAGLSNKEIAAILGTSPHTVQKQSISVYRKTGLSGRAQLAARFARGQG